MYTIRGGLRSDLTSSLQCYYCSPCKHAIIIEWEWTLASAEKEKKKKKNEKKKIEEERAEVQALRGTRRTND